MLRMVLLVLVLIAGLAKGAEKEAVGPSLQQTSVTIKKSYNDVGSATIILRQIEGKQVAWVLTAAHVIDNLRTVESVIAPDGTERKQVSYKDAELMQQIRQGGRPVRQTLDFAKVISVDKQRDIGLLRVRAEGGYMQGAIFWLDETIPSVGTPIYHVASPGGGNLNDASVTAGIIAQVGRTIEKFGGAEAVYDQSDAAALPGCLTGDTMVQLADGDSTRIDKLIGGENVLTCDSRIAMSTGQWEEEPKAGKRVLSFQTQIGTSIKKTGDCNLRPVCSGKITKVWSTGVKQVLKITTNSKSVRATANHPFVRIREIKPIDGRKYYFAEWCPAGELQLGDIVGTLKEHVEYRKSQLLPIAKTFGQRKDNDYADVIRLCGFYVGDGYSRIRKGEGGEVCLYTYNDSLSQRYESTLKRYWRYAVTNVNTASGSYLRVASKDLAELFHRLGLTGYAKTKRLPMWVFSLPTILQREFLEGYIDADGHRAKKGNTSWWAIGAANQGLVEDLYILATNLGLRTSNIRARDRVAVLDGRSIKSHTWGCDIYPNSIRDGSLWAKGTTDLLPDGLRWERITVIEPAGEEMTYDMTVGETHTFFANGFLVHNSSGGMIALQSDGRWIGMITLGLESGDSFHYFVPIRRVREWAKTVNCVWLLDPKEKQPTEDEIAKIPLENTPIAFNRPKSTAGGAAAAIKTMELLMPVTPSRLLRESYQTK